MEAITWTTFLGEGKGLEKHKKPNIKWSVISHQAGVYAPDVIFMWVMGYHILRHRLQAYCPPLPLLDMTFSLSCPHTVTLMTRLPLLGLMRSHKEA